MAEPPAKKTKDSIDTCFSEFRKCTEKFNYLKNAVAAFLYGLESTNIGVWHIDNCNARTCVSFSKAACSVSLCSDANGKKKIYKICEIFQPGITILMKYVDKQDPEIPEDEAYQSALEKLIKFLSEDHQALFERSTGEKEGDWAIRVAQHLLSPLAVANGYTIDSYKDFPRRTTKCPCQQGDDLLGEVGDTTFGCALGWHGWADILMDEVTVELASGEIEDAKGIGDAEWMEDAEGLGDAEGMGDAESMFSTSSSTEIKDTKNFSDSDISHIIAQTIVFSFLQHKNNKTNLNNFLIPGIGVSTKSMVGFFYECEEDVLLLTEPLDLTAGVEQDLNVCTIVFLWLTLNYKLFCSGITDEMKQYKADFYIEAGKLLDVYKNDVTRPVHKTHRESEPYTKLRGWSKKMNQEEGFEPKDYGINFLKLK